MIRASTVELSLLTGYSCILPLIQCVIEIRQCCIARSRYITRDISEYILCIGYKNLGWKTPVRYIKQCYHHQIIGRTGWRCYALGYTVIVAGDMSFADTARLVIGLEIPVLTSVTAHVELTRIAENIP